MHLKLLVFSLFLTLIILNSFGQDYSVDSKKAIKRFEESEELLRARNFDGAIELLYEAIDKEPGFVEAYLKLGAIYRILGADDKSHANFLKAAELKPSSKELSGAYLTLGHNFIEKGEYQNALTYFEKVVQFPPRQFQKLKEAERMIETCNFALEAMKEPLDFDPEMMGKNINFTQFQAYPALTADKSMFIFSVRQGPGGMSDENLAVVYDENGDWSQPQSLSDNINTKFNEGACALSGDGQTLVFASCNRRDGYGSCDLYVSYREGDEWSVPKNLGEDINTPAWESEPTLSADGNTLYFSSDRKDGMGGEDIYKSVKDGNGVWQPGVNIGAPVNTENREVSPFIHANGRTLFFASTGHPGMGKFDLFSAELNQDGSWGVPENLGYPLNTYDNEVSLFITSDFKKGYYSKYKRIDMTRASSMIYSFDVPDPIKSKFKTTYSKGYVYDAETKERLGGAVIELVKLETGKVDQKVYSDKKTGEYLLVLTEGSEYALYINKEGYLFESMHFDYTDKTNFDPMALNIGLKPLKSGQRITLNNIFFKSGSYELEEKSMEEIKRLKKLLENNPEVKVQIAGYTDNVGSKEDNIQLSLNRAKEVYSYLKEIGVSSDRLSYKGFGEKSPVASNETAEGRAKNRRIEFNVL